MILAVDIGNTNIVLGIIDDDKLLFSGRLATNIYETDYEYAMKISSFMKINGVKNLDGAIISSVVPNLISTMKKAIKLISDINIIVVGPGVKTGLSIKIDDPATLGADLVVGAVAAKEKYELPAIVFDLGTATTATVLNKKGEYIGGAIAPGVITALNALSSGTAQLPQIDLKVPKKAIGTNTIDCMQSGIVIGNAAMIDGLIDKFNEELGEKATVIATGGLAKSIVVNCKNDIIVDDDLLIEGMKIIYNKNV